jgi:hypothetical protein
VKLSIVTASYRSALTIDEFTAARSRLRTDTDDIELVMVTDGSPDVASRLRYIEPIRGWSPSISRATSATARR